MKTHDFSSKHIPKYNIYDSNPTGSGPFRIREIKWEDRMVILPMTLNNVLGSTIALSESDPFKQFIAVMVYHRVEGEDCYHAVCFKRGNKGRWKIYVYYDDGKMLNLHQILGKLVIHKHPARAQLSSGKFYRVHPDVPSNKIQDFVSGMKRRQGMSRPEKGEGCLFWIVEGWKTLRGPLVFVGILAAAVWIE